MYNAEVDKTDCLDRSKIYRAKKDYWPVFIDLYGNEVIPAGTFTFIGEFAQNGLARVKTTHSLIGRYGYINTCGRIVLPVQFKYASDFSDQGLAVVHFQTTGSWYTRSRRGAYIDQYGTIRNENYLKYGISPRTGFNEGLARASRTEPYGFIGYIKKVHHGYVPKVKYGYADKSGQVILDFEWDDANEFTSNGIAPVKKDGKWGFIDNTGTEVIGYQYDSVGGFTAAGISAVQQDGKWGLINAEGLFVAPLVYEHIGRFSNGMAVFKKNGKFGYFDSTGEEIIPPKINLSFDFGNHNYARFINKNDRKFGYINKYGEVAISPLFDWAYDFDENGLAVVSENDKWGVINLNGEIIAPLIYDQVNRHWKHELALVRIDDKYGYIDAQGKLVVDAKYDSPDSLDIALEKVAYLRNK